MTTIIRPIFDNKVDVPKLWSDQSIQTSTLADCVEPSHNFTLGQDAMLVNRRELRAVLNNKRKFCLVAPLNFDFQRLRIDLKLSMTGHLADLASIPRTYFRRLLRKNPKLAVILSTTVSSNLLYDRWNRRYGEIETMIQVFASLAMADMFGSAHHADDVVFLPDMFVSLGKRLEKNFDAEFSDESILEELEMNFPKPM